MSQVVSAIKAALIGRRLWEAHGAHLVGEPVAIVGMGCRFPGGVHSPEAFWELLLAGRDAVSEVPADRWDAEGLYDPDPAKPGTVSSRWGGFLEDARGFDAEYFGITPGEAASMDPQQRVALEVACEAIEDAGVPFETLRGSATGVYFSVYHNDYAFLQYSERASVGARTLTGAMHSVLPNRISYVLGLHGPSVMVDTACSSSLVGVHLACQALRTRECDLAVVGGVNLNLSPEVTIALSKGGFMSPRGRCRTFDAGADGFVRGEGCGAVVLKRLADAIADGDAIRAVIRGSAVNHDGESTTLSAPNGLAQAALVRRALADAGVEPHEITLIEAHGTGTELGDPIEVDALAAVFGGRDEEFGACHLGSLKANVGHPEAAAGVAGLIKLVLCMEHGTVPPHPHLTAINPHIDLRDTPFRFVREATPWAAPTGRRLAGVSSFGVGGTNAHVILEEPPAAVTPTATDVEPPFLLAISARSAAALRKLAGDYTALLRREPAAAGAICRAAARRRTHHRRYRAGLAGGSAEALAARLEALATGDAAAITPSPEEAPALCFVYSGQGTQRPGMGLALMARDARFRDSMERVDAACRSAHGFSVLEEIEKPGEDSGLDRTDIAQVAIFAVQVALTDWLAEHGIRPGAVIGHSSGELASAYAAGMLSLDDALAAVVDRGRAMQATFDRGRMLSVRTGEAVTREIVNGSGLEVSVAAVNGPRHVVVSGEVDAVAEARRLFESRGLECRELPVRFGFHSRLMGDAAEELARAQHGLAGVAGPVPLISTVTGAPLDRIDGEYLARNVRSTVRFADAVTSALGAGVTRFVELGPDAVLGGPVLETAAENGVSARVAFALHRERDEATTALALIGRLYEWGEDPDWSAVYPGLVPPFPLPRYPWQHRPYWLPGSPRTPGDSPESKRTPARLPGRRLRSPLLDRPVFELETDDPLFDAFADHVIGGTRMLPGTAVLELIRKAAEAASPFERTGGDTHASPAGAADVVLLRPIALGGPGAIQVVLDPDGDGGVRCEVHVSARGAEWQLAATAMVEMKPTDGEPLAVDETLTGEPEAAGTPLDTGEFYDSLAQRGYSLGPGFQLLDRVTCWSDRAHGELAPDSLAPWPDSPHPAALDACAHLCMAILHTRGALPPGAVFLPWSVDRYVAQPSTSPPARAVARLASIGDTETVFDVAMLAADGSVLARLDGWRLRRAAARPEPLRVIRWTPAGIPPGESRTHGHWLLLNVGGGASASGRGDDSGAPTEDGATDPLMASVAAAFERAGRTVEVIRPRADIPPAVLATLAATDDEPGTYEGVVLLAASAIPTIPGEPSAAASNDAHACRALLALTGALADDRADSPRLLVVTRGAQSVGEASSAGDPPLGAVLGLSRSVRAERPWLRCTSLDLDPAPGVRALPEAEATRVVAEALAGNADGEVAIRGEERLVRGRGAGAFVDNLKRPAGPIVLSHGSPGTLDGFSTVPTSSPAEPPPGHVLVRVEAAGVNFKDVLAALGEIPGESVRGHEAAGEVVATGEGVEAPRPGDRVLVYWPGCFGSYVVAPVGSVFPAPRGFSPTACATLPIAFGTAWYALYDVARIGPDSRVLVHAGAGGVGMAAIQLAMAAGARVFATAGSPGKRAMLERLGVAAAFDSRTTSFADEVLAATDGAGVDVVLNSLTGERIAAGLRCLRAGGTFIELGTRERLTAAELSALRDDVRYTAFELNEVADADPGLLPRIFHEIRERCEAGQIRPLPASIFDVEHAGAAFRRMARADHVGKIVLAMPPTERPALERGWCVVTGGTGALGTATARWLAGQGARRIAILARRPPDADATALLEALRPLGTDVRAIQVDVADADALRDALASLRAEASITAVFHAAGLVDDATLATLDQDRLRGVLAPKVDGAWNLHLATLDDPIDAFVLYSAIGPILDGAGQGAYAAANAALDALAVWRRAHGLPAVSVIWGAWSGAGMAAELNEAHRRRWSRLGLEPWSPDAGAAMLDDVLAAAPAVVVAARLRERAEDAGPTHARRIAGPSVSKAGELAVPTSGEAGAGAGLVKRLALAPPHARLAIAHDYVRRTVTTILGHDAPVDPARPLRDLGLDSLSAIELRNAISVALGRPLPAALAFDHPTVDALAAHLLDLTSEPASAAAAGPTDTVDDPAGTTETMADAEGADVVAPAEPAPLEIAALSDEEAERLLAREIAELHAGEEDAR